jgi:hypothetical protein
LSAESNAVYSGKDFLKERTGIISDGDNCSKHKEGQYWQHYNISRTNTAALEPMRGRTGGQKTYTPQSLIGTPAIKLTARFY